MSQEEAVESERREVMELLEKPLTPEPSALLNKGKRNSLQPLSTRTASYIPSGSPPVRRASTAVSGTGTARPPTRRWSVLGVSEPSSSSLRLSFSSATSAAKSLASSEGSLSTSPGDSNKMPERIDMAHSVPDQSVPEHATSSQVHEPSPSKTAKGRSAIAAMMARFELKAHNSDNKGKDHSRRRRRLSLDSKSFPSAQSLFPLNNQRMNTSSSVHATEPETIVTDRGKVIDKNNAHKYLSDEALAQSSGSLARLARLGTRHSSDGDGTRSPGGERLEKDMYDSENNAIETSEEENGMSSSDDDAGNDAQMKDSKRGRRKPADSSAQVTENEAPLGSDVHPGETKTAGEEPSAGQTVESSIKEPEPEAFAQKPKSLGVHPQTSFNDPESVLNTPFGSDDEAELSDIKKAQKLSILMSSIDSSIPNRTIRTIIRGDYNSILGGSDDTRRRQRKYLVATDLSDESVYALEWTIGTILRDGDTLFAVCVLHEENSTNPSIQAGESNRPVPDIASIVGSQTAEATIRDLYHDSSTLPRRSLLHFLGHGAENRPRSADSQGMSNAEMDRARTVEAISQTCVGLLRKTMLQVRIAVEVIHCKNQKHMITEAIDGLEPTLVVVGARGTNALKGVLLGSFSNYLVSKSSVPVMVARRKLRSQSSKKKTNIRLSNNLSAPKRLALARVD